MFKNVIYSWGCEATFSSFFSIKWSF